MSLFGHWNWWLPDFAAKALFVRPSRAPEQPALDSVYVSRLGCVGGVGVHDQGSR